MNNLKTTASAVSTGILTLLSYYGVFIPESLALPVLVVGFVITGYFAADAKKAGS